MCALHRYIANYLTKSVCLPERSEGLIPSVVNFAWGLTLSDLLWEKNSNLTSAQIHMSNPPGFKIFFVLQIVLILLQPCKITTMTATPKFCHLIMLSLTTKYPKSLGGTVHSPQGCSQESGVELTKAIKPVGRAERGFPQQKNKANCAIETGMNSKNTYGDFKRETKSLWPNSWGKKTWREGDLTTESIFIETQKQRRSFLNLIFLKVKEHSINLIKVRQSENLPLFSDK